ncbi:DNA glycosylase [Neisseria sp. ZJ106]|uniref:DNA glycosylase n=1 Tax=Neisseria lisongii TaxID=2912188 RepID=A0ABY7RKK6_9NEIS|nr:DNA glycosylase [Neisseria lisongii]MCF7521349.1 DNA glycosylase [Neisseria lisongii]WCL71874.1 DNA glycosylase [Neisseria lisongii]
MTEAIIETHPFPPLLPPHATVMLMGTFPPKADKHAMAFHYPNFQNDMWRIYGLVFFNNAQYFQKSGEKAFDADKIKAFLWEKGIASCPTVAKAIRLQDNASDKFLKIVETVDLEKVLAQLPDCRKIATTGGKATEVLLDIMPSENGQSGKSAAQMPKTNQTIVYPFGGRDLTLTRLPSTSRAYPLSLAAKTAAYRAFFEAAGLV